MPQSPPEWFENVDHGRPLGRMTKQVAFAVARPPFRALHMLLAQSRGARAVFFDTAAPGHYLVGGSIDGGAFIAPTRDKVVARSVYTRGGMDFDKTERALALAGIPMGQSVMIDIGANIGSICIPFVKRGFGRAAIAVEPEPANFNLLLANIALNGLGDRITPINAALGDTEGHLELALNADNCGDHRIVSGAAAGTSVGASAAVATRPVVRVAATTLDSVVDRHPDDHLFLWMDTQGYEGYVLAGAPRTLARRVPLALEFWPQAMVASGSYPALRRALVSAGYERFHRLGEKHPRRIALSEASLDALYDELGEDGPYTDILVL